MEEDDGFDKEEERLYYALIANDVSTLTTLLKEETSVNFKFEGQNQWGKSALHLCSETGNIECAEILLAHGAKLNMEDNWQQTPLMYAVCTERSNMVTLLLKESTVGINHRDRFGKTAAHFAVNNTGTDCLQELIDRGADTDIMDDKGRCPVMYSVMEDGHMHVLQCLLRAGCDVNLDSNVGHMTPLQVAIRYAKEDIMAYVDELLDAGANPNTFDSFGNTPLTTLMIRAHSHRFQVQDYERYSSELTRLLLNKGLDPNLISTCPGPTLHHFHGTALKKAVLCYTPSFIEILLQAGADPDIPDNDAATPLLHAARVNGLKVGQMLLRANCDMDSLGNVRLNDRPTPLPLTPFNCAIIKKHWDFAAMLVYAGYNLQRERYLVTDQKIPSPLRSNKMFLDWLQRCLLTPPDLMVLARTCCRKHLRCPMSASVISLTMSPSIRQILLLEDVLPDDMNHVARMVANFI